MDAKEIIQIIEEESDKDWWEVKQKITEEPTTEEFIHALQQSRTNEDTYRVLCEIAGRRKEAQATPYLIEALQHPSSDIRHEAAQALSKIESPEAGEPLLTQYLQETTEARVWELIALGASRYPPAIPYFIQALQDDELRRYAALGLASLKAREGIEPIKQAITQESSPFAIQLMQQALKDIES